MTSKNVTDTITFLNILGRLKGTKRTGWVESEIPQPESVSDHMYRAAMMCMLCPDQTLDRNRLIRMALCHDAGESIVGDISPRMGVPKEEKYRREKSAVEYLSSLIGTDSPLAAELPQLWEEYEAQATPEARFLKDIDLLEMVIQARSYEERHPELDLSSFFESGEKIQHPWARAIFVAAAQSRKGGRTADAIIKGEDDNSCEI